MRRRSLLENKPYDSEIAYIQSDGSQIIDTKLSGGSNAEYEIKVQVLNANIAWDVLFGSKQNNNLTYFGAPRFYYHTQNGGFIGAATAYKTAGNNLPIVTSNAYDIYTFSFKGGKIYSNDVLKYDIGNFGFGNKNFCIFGYLEERYFKIAMKLFYAKIWLDGELVRDMIPVRIGQIGYLYDKVSGEFFSDIYGNNFIIGEDI